MNWNCSGDTLELRALEIQVKSNYRAGVGINPITKEFLTCWLSLITSVNYVTGGRKESLLIRSVTLLKTGESFVHSVGLEKCFCLFRVKLLVFIHMHGDGEDPHTSPSALLWVEVKAHLYVVAGVDAGVLADRLAVPAQLVHGWRVLESLGRSSTAPRVGSVS